MVTKLLIGLESTTNNNVSVCCFNRLVAGRARSVQSGYSWEQHESSLVSLPFAGRKPVQFQKDWLPEKLHLRSLIPHTVSNMRVCLR